jgi:23S rRNA pseudouridine2605 synthase
MQERLQKIIARAGITSRRHAEQLILSGQVRVNGRVVTELGTKADPEHDRIEAAGKAVQKSEGHVYLMLHKPPQVVATLADPVGRKTLRHYLRGLAERVYPVGRLDYAASGLVFMTNDGDLAAAMLKGAARLPQRYEMKVKGRLSDQQLAEMGKQYGARLRPMKQPFATRGHAANFWYEVTLRSASRDALRRALASAGHPVEKLRRVAIGPLELTVLEGRYRRAEPRELERLRRALAGSDGAKPAKESPGKREGRRRRFRPSRGTGQRGSR